MKKKIFRYSILIVVIIVVVFTAGFFVGKNQVVCKVCKPETLDFSLFWDAYSKLEEKFIHKEEIDNQKLLYGAISGMTKSLGDPYTDFFDPSQAKAFQQDLLGSFEGIGVEVGIKKEQLTIIAPLSGTPGELAGLKAGDVIVKINNTSAADMAIDQAVSIIRGKKGTPVTLTIFRDGWNATKDFTIIRDTIKINSVKWELKNDTIAYIHIMQFNQSLPDDFKKIALEILSSPAKKIILDLRDDPGGYLEICKEIAGWFLEQGQVLTIEDFGKDRDPIIYKAEGNATFAQYPIVVLINKGSASASEILAGALRDNRNVTLIGEKSFGKGSVQEMIELQDGVSFLKITIAKWLTPKKTLIAEVGLTPDIKIEPTDDEILSKKDVQLEKALEIINNLH